MIYLDNNATTQPSTYVIDAMLPYLTDCFFNPSASNTAFTNADKPRRQAAERLCMQLNAEEPECFIFTSGATESNNWVFADLFRKGNPGRIVISSIEHASVSEPALELQKYGFEILEAPVDKNGVVIVEEFMALLSNDTIMVSIMAANNETGVLQPLDEIGKIVRRYIPNALFHTDGTQAIGKSLVDLQDRWPEVDLLSFSAHKFHGPKGIGGLYVRPGIELQPMLRGGGQERGLRSGTVNTAALAGLAAAIADVDLITMDAVRSRRDEFEEMLVGAFPEVVIHSRNSERLPNTSAFSLPGVMGEEIVQLLAEEEIIVSTGAACSSGALRPPKTVLALGTPYTLAEGSLRVSLSSQSPADFSERLVRALIRLIRN